MHAVSFRSAATPPASTSRRGALRLPALLILLAAGVLAPAGIACRDDRAPAGSAADEQVFRFRLREDPPTLDPAMTSDNLSEAITANVFRGLVQLDPETLTIVPAVAAAWEISPDHLTYTFTLRDDVIFHNGRRLTADDVVYSFTRLLDPAVNSPRRFVLEPIDGAGPFAEGTSSSVTGLTSPDPHTIRIRLARPYAPFLGLLSMVNAAILPREVYDDPQRGYQRSPVGCGPFLVSRWEQSNLIELRAFDRFYGGRPTIDRIEARIIENLVSALQEYRAGGLDSLDQPPAEDDALYEELKPEIRRYPYIATGYFGFNLAIPPFKGNPALRKAINYAVDKKYLWEILMPGGNIPAHGIIPPGIAGYDPNLPGYPVDLGRARSLLAEAGYPGGRGLAPFTLWSNTSEDNRRIALQIQSDLKRIGVQVTLREADWAAYIPAVEGTAEKPGQAQMFRFGWNLDYPDADAILRPLLYSSNIGPAGNSIRYHNPQVDRLLDEALIATDPQRRAALYREAERIAVMDDAVFLFLNYYESWTLFKPWVKGIVLTPLGEFRIPLERLRIDRSGS